MNTTDAMTKALSKKSVKKKYNAATIRSIRKRLKDGTLTLDFQVSFLSDNGYDISKPMAWKKAQKAKLNVHTGNNFGVGGVVIEPIVKTETDADNKEVYR